MVKIKMSHVLGIIAIVVIIVSDIYGINNLIYNREVFKQSITFLEGLKNLTIGLSFFITITCIALMIPDAISWFCKLEFTINTNKIKQILNNLK